LFEKHREQIYENASSLITAYQSKPFFLLNLFKKVQLLVGDEVAQQQLLLTLDELLEGEESEEEDVVDELHENVNAYLASIAISGGQSFSSTTLNEISMNICGSLHGFLTSQMGLTGEMAMDVMNRYKPSLDELLKQYEGKQVNQNWQAMSKQVNEFLDRVCEFDAPV
jgi:hypothetical protein